MSKKVYMIINYCLLFLSCVILPIHYFWALIPMGFNPEVAVGYFFYALFVYGFAIAIYTVTHKRLKKEQTNWDIIDRVFYILFSFSYLFMLVYITVVGIVKGIAFGYNMILVFLFPMAFFGMLWLLFKHKPKKGQIAHIILFSLPLVSLLAMVIVTVVVYIKEWIRLAGAGAIEAGNAPGWVTPVLYGAPILAAALVLMLVYLIFHFIAAKAEKKKINNNTQTES